MQYIKSLRIEGLGKFEELNVEFNNKMNIIVGENEAGKSTILEAIKIVLNQQYKNVDKSVIIDLFNRGMVEKFHEEPCVRNLPYISIEMILELDEHGKNAPYFYGQNNIKETEMFGITFECKFDTTLGVGLEVEIEKGKIPYEYYNLKWTTFCGLPYIMIKRPFGFIAIDTSAKDTNNSFNYFNKTLFNNRYEEQQRLKAKNDFRDNINTAFTEIDLPKLDEGRCFGINDKKVILESIISVYEGSVPLENKGSGMESLIKTEIALDKQKTNLEVVLLEEPENHLSYTNLLKMLEQIQNKEQEAQIIVTTHNDMIASRLNLKNILWVAKQQVKSLETVPSAIADFFVKVDNNNLLKLLLSEKVIMVEGATEYLLMPYIYKKITGSSLEADKISVISCNGISYKNYLEVVKNTEKRIAVITDNDKKSERINEASLFNDEHVNQRIYMDKEVENWTWEAALYNLNKEKLDALIPVKDDAKYLFHGEDYGRVLGCMLNKKVRTAYLILSNELDIEIPEYVKEAIIWVRE